ncbi:uncharacterized protein LOC125385267 [Bombus terrestris]|uniref:Uncharacterized protein LOC125385267 n=1 Tax=Bombus terrestris TaxID=30195 RepID=A0A9C6VZQ0_BOMTE|nr:uncharacterized protein LOC125385267 [Bombus terrestris]
MKTVLFSSSGSKICKSKKFLTCIVPVSGSAFPPEFADTIQNVTVSLGRDATFTCLVNHLGCYRVGRVKVDTKAIQAIHDHVITHNNRVLVSHSDHTTWNLHIKNVQQEDEGRYMCQINTDPMKSQSTCSEDELKIDKSESLKTNC